MFNLKETKNLIIKHGYTLVLENHSTQAINDLTPKNVLKLIRLKNMISGDIQLGIVYQDNIEHLSSNVKYYSLSRFAHDAKGLLDVGLNYNKKQLDKLISRIQSFLNNYPMYYFYDRIGFHYMNDDTLTYFGSRAISYESELPSTIIQGNLISCENHLKSLGSLETSVKFISNLIKGKVEAQTILSVALSSILIGILKRQPILLNICGSSSIGKSIFSQLATSLYSSPRDEKISTNFDSTEMALEAFLHSNNGIAVVIDDKSTGYENIEFQRMIYNLSKGISRRRIKPASQELNSLKTWNNSIIMSSEDSFFKNFDLKKQGSNRRFLEIEVGLGDLTSSAKEANDIKHFMNSNYGLIASEFVSRLKTNQLSIESLETLLSEEILLMQNDIDSDGVQNGYIEMIAPATLAASLTNQLLGLEFDVDDLRDYIISTGKSMISKFSNEPVITLEDSHRIVTSKYMSRFPELKDDDDYINIPVGDFTEFELELGYQKNILRELFKSKNLLKINSGRKYDFTVKSKDTLKAKKVISVKINL